MSRIRNDGLRAPTRCALGVQIACAAAVLILMATASAAAGPATTFKTKCSVCHTVGAGDKVGPDLHGVHERRSAEWIAAFVRSSQQVIASGDPVAVALFDQFDQRTMPDHPLDDTEIADLIAFIAAGGPSEGSTFRRAPEASIVEASEGRRIFHRRNRASNTIACVSCHSLATEDRSFGGTLGGALGTVYSRFHDVELARVLEAPAMPGSGCRRPALDPDASLALRAFLFQIDSDLSETEARGLSASGAGLAAGFVFFCLIQLGGARKPHRSGARRIVQPGQHS